MNTILYFTVEDAIKNIIPGGHPNALAGKRNFSDHSIPMSLPC